MGQCILKAEQDKASETDLHETKISDKMHEQSENFREDKTCRKEPDKSQSGRIRYINRKKNKNLKKRATGFIRSEEQREKRKEKE